MITLERAVVLIPVSKVKKQMLKLKRSYPNNHKLTKVLATGDKVQTRCVW